MRNQQELVGMCLALVEGQRALSVSERTFVKHLPGSKPNAREVDAVREAILSGSDPLGEAFSSTRSASERRTAGAVYTPLPIVQSMMAWIATQGKPARIVDPGAGSGRFMLAAGEAFPGAQLVAVELDPLSALMLRANLRVRGWMDRAMLMVEDYRGVELPRTSGMTAFIGNPPYVRHHDIAGRWKKWYAARFADLGIKASGLAGLHLHFFLQTRLLARRADVGALITSAEWLDVNYGSALRRLLLDELGCTALHVLNPTVKAFPGTATTAAITCFRVGETVEPVRVRSLDALSGLNGLSNATGINDGSGLNDGTDIPREQLRAASRWSPVVSSLACSRDGTRDPHGVGTWVDCACRDPIGEIELGELFRVHRGQVTGANAIWIAGEHAEGLPDRVKLPAVTKAQELFNAGAQLRSAGALRRVVDLPPELDGFTKEERKRINAFLCWARALGADRGYIAQHRKAWWSVDLKAPAPILCTYMARRPPQFTLNACDARHINIAHGLYPRAPLALAFMARLVTWLNTNISTGSGRTYAGGLTKFEPREIERLRIPNLPRQ